MAHVTSERRIEGLIAGRWAADGHPCCTAAKATTTAAAAAAASVVL